MSKDIKNIFNTESNFISFMVVGAGNKGIKCIEEIIEASKAFNKQVSIHVVDQQIHRTQQVRMNIGGVVESSAMNIDSVSGSRNFSVVAIKDSEQQTAVIKEIEKSYPDTKIVIRATV